MVLVLLLVVCCLYKKVPDQTLEIALFVFGARDIPISNVPIGYVVLCGIRYLRVSTTLNLDRTLQKSWFTF